MKRRWPVLQLFFIIGLIAGNAGAADEPPARGQMLNPQKLVEHVRASIAGMELTDAQKTKVGAILDKADIQAKALADQIANLEPREKFAKVGPFFRDIREQLSQELNPDQVKQLGEKLNPGRPGAAAMTALQAALGKLDLSADQKKQIDEVLDQARQDGRSIRQRAMSGEDVAGDTQQIRDEIRQKLGDILTADQQQQLRDLMRQSTADTPAKAPATAPAKTEEKDKELSPSGPELGAPAPDIKIEMSPDHPVALSTFKGHVVVIEFGSLSCPTFRERAAEMEKLKNEIGLRAYFVLIYTREAHPAGDKQIERNKKDQIDIAQPADIGARKAVADRAVKTLHVSLPVTVDDMDDLLVKALGGFPNGCIVIGKDGNIAARQRWVEPVALRRLIDEALKSGT